MEKQVKKDKYTVTEVGTLIEALRSEFRPLLEQIPGIKNKLDSVYEQVGRNTEKIEENRFLINRVLEQLKTKADQKDLEALEQKVASLTS